MARSILTIAAMLLAPALLIYASAHAGLFSTCSSDRTSFGVAGAAYAVGIAALLGSRLPRRTRLILGGVYTLAAFPIGSVVMLSASCSAGVCCL